MTVSGQASPVTYAYDNATRLTGITQGTAGVSFGYDGTGRRTSLTLPNGIVVGYSYDQGSQLTGLTYSLSGNTLGNLGYAYDADGRRTQLGGTWARTGIPSATTSTAVYNVANELTGWNGAALTYDANGNLTSDALFAPRMNLRGGTNTYTWDARNQLASISGVVTASFSYDPFGRRQGKTIGGTITNFLYDGVNPVQELSGTTVNANLLTGGVDEYFTRTDALGTSNFLSDALGSTLALADTTGTVRTSYTYQPFGGTTTQGSANGNSYQFTGRENDGDGLYFYRARYYSPMFARFISEDPAGFGANSVNFYEYAYDDPMGYRDPSGTQVEAPTAPPPAPPAPVPAAPPAESPAVGPGPGGPGVGVGPGTLLGVIGAILSFPQDLNPNEPDPGRMSRPKCKTNKTDCDAQQEQDEAVCRGLRNPAARARCWASANERYGACRAGRQLPPLVTW